VERGKKRETTIGEEPTGKKEGKKRTLSPGSGAAMGGRGRKKVSRERKRKRESCDAVGEEKKSQIARNG